MLFLLSIVIWMDKMREREKKWAKLDIMFLFYAKNKKRKKLHFNFLFAIVLVK